MVFLNFGFINFYSELLLIFISYQNKVNPLNLEFEPV